MDTNEKDKEDLVEQLKHDRDLAYDNEDYDTVRFIRQQLLADENIDLEDELDEEAEFDILEEC